MTPDQYPTFSLSWATSNVDRVSIDGPGTKDFSNLAPTGIQDGIVFDCSTPGMTESFTLVAIGSDGKQVVRDVTVTNNGVIPDPEPTPDPTPTEPETETQTQTETETVTP
jgi:hypothetical protein